MATYVRKICGFCGEECTGKYCNYCSTKEKRRDMILKQIEINRENAGKGLPTNMAFGRMTIEELSKEYDIKIES